MVDIKPFKGTRPFNEEAKSLIAPSTDHLSIENNNGKSIFNAPFTKESVQFTILIVAGKEIIIVILLYM